VLPLGSFRQNSGNLLSVMAEIIVGPWFRRLMAADAVLALCGGALTAFIGVVGLVVRMTEEGMFPEILLRQNRYSQTHHFIHLTFLALTSTLYMITGGDISSLTGVYTVSFLGVLSVAIAGCIMVRSRRRRTRILSWHIWTALLGIGIGITGQLFLNPRILLYFSSYFFPMMAVSFFTLIIRN
jgi:amino acid transporter